jgi:sugar/nucleoside kinase (ribokinase family)
VAGVFVIGDLNIDIICSLKRMPKSEGEVHSDSIDLSIGGNAANFAVALARLGQRPEFYSCIGEDWVSGFLRSELESTGVKPRLRTYPGQSGISIAFVMGGGRRSYVSNKGVSEGLSVKDLEPILKRIRPGDLVYAGGLFHLPKLMKSFKGFASRARKKGAVLMFDFTFDDRGCSDCFPDLAKHLDMVFLNRDELNKFSRGSLEKSLKKISSLGVRDVVVKLGSKGSAFYTNGMLRTRPGHKVRAVNPVGAGDVFNAGFVYGYLSGLSSESSLELGNWIAAWKLVRKGIEVPDRKRLVDFLKKFG